MKYENIIFLQGEEADEAMTRLDGTVADVLFEYLKQWDNGDSQIETTEGKPWGIYDRVNYYDNGYVLSYSTSFSNCGLIRVIE